MASDDYPDELQDKIDNALIEGWKIHKQSDNEVVMIKRRRASVFWHIVIAILTAWWTFGLGNVLYWAKCRYGDAETITLRA